MAGMSGLRSWSTYGWLSCVPGGEASGSSDVGARLLVGDFETAASDMCVFVVRHWPHVVWASGCCCLCGPLCEVINLVSFIKLINSFLLNELSELLSLKEKNTLVLPSWDGKNKARVGCRSHSNF